MWPLNTKAEPFRFFSATFCPLPRHYPLHQPSSQSKICSNCSIDTNPYCQRIMGSGPGSCWLWRRANAIDFAEISSSSCKNVINWLSFCWVFTTEPLIDRNNVYRFVSSAAIEIKRKVKHMFYLLSQASCIGINNDRFLSSRLPTARKRYCLSVKPQKRGIDFKVCLRVPC